jgi:hypothetical protein
MKTIVVITTSYPRDASGSEAAGAFVADFVDELSHKAKVIVLAPGEHQATKLKSYEQTSSIDETGEIHIYRYWSPDKPLGELSINSFRNIIAIVRVLASGLLTAHKIARNHQQIDFVFGLWVFPSGFWARYLAWLKNCHYGTWALGSDI